MAGRAGRRGMDKIGYVIYAPVYNMPSQTQMRNIMTGKPETIKSQMNPDYNLLLKLLLSRSVSLDKFSKSTLYNKEVVKYVTTKKEVLKDSIKKPEIDEKDEKLLEEYLKMVNKNKEYQELGYTLSNKMIKNQRKFQNKIKKSIDNFDKVWKEYREYMDQSDDQNQAEKDIEVESNKFYLVCKDMLELLDYHKYIKVKNVKSGNLFEDIEINKTGVIASQINECNPLLLTEMIVSGIFDDLSPQEIVGLLAIFINDVKSGEEITVKQVKGTNKLHEKFHQINKIIDTYIDSEKYCYLEFHLKDYWKVNYEMVDLALEWASGKSLGEVLSKTDMYEGNFVKNMLKIANIAKDLSCLFKIHGELEILPKLDKVTELVVRDVVTINSLYLKMI
jgi:superfamily II RNA helicase